VAEEIRETVAGTFLDGAPVIPVSGVTGDGLDALRAALETVAARLPERPAGPWPRLPVDRVFAARGFGTIVTGTLQGGALRVGDALEAVPAGPTGKIRGLQVHGAAVDEAGPQRRVAVNLQGVDRERLSRGMVLVPPGLGSTTVVFDALLEVTPDAPAPLEDEQRVRVHHGTAELLGRLRLPGERPLLPGARGAAQIRLEAPLAALPGDRFILRRYSPVTTLGGGIVVDLDPPRWRRDDPAWPQRTDELAQAGPPERLARAARDAGPEGVDLAERAVRLGLTRETARAVATTLERTAASGARVVLLEGDRLLAVPAREALFARIAEELARAHAERPLEEGPAPERLRGTIAPAFSPEQFRGLLARLEARGAIVVRPDAVRLATHQAVPEGEQAERLAAVRRALDAAGYEALAEAELLAQLGGGPAARQLLAFAARRGEAVKLKDDLWLGGAAWERMVRRLREEAAAGRATIDVATFKELFGISRKYAIPLLEKLDAEAVTQRIGNERRVRPPR
jgi:selenocysteine-specific elongation factor